MAATPGKKYLPQVGVDSSIRVEVYRKLGWEEVEVRLESLLPLLMDNPLHTMGVTQKAGQKVPTREQETEQSVYKTDNGQLYFPTDGAFKAMLTAAKTASKIKGKSVSTLLQERAFFSPQKMLLENEKGEPVKTWEVASHRIVLGAASGAKMKHRALVPYWQATILVQYHPVDIDLDVVLTELRKGGLTVGLGAYRIRTAKGNPGHFGMFHVKDVKQP